MPSRKMPFVWWYTAPVQPPGFEVCCCGKDKQTSVGEHWDRPGTGQNLSCGPVPIRVDRLHYSGSGHARQVSRQTARCQLDVGDGRLRFEAASTSLLEPACRQKDVLDHDVILLLADVHCQ